MRAHKETYSKGGAKREPTMGEATHEWAEQCLCRYSPVTQAQYARVCRDFLAYCPAKVKDVHTEHIEKYLSHVLARTSASTANIYLAVINGLCKYVSRKYGTPNVSANIDHFAEEPPNSRFLTQEEYASILAICRPFERDVIQFLANTGVTVSEFLSLKWGDIDANLQHITIVGEGRKHRTIPLNGVCRGILAKYQRLPNSAHIQFVKWHYPKGLYRLCCRVAERAGIPSFGALALRHRFAVALIRKRVPIIKLSKLLGHSSVIVTSQCYHQWLPKSKRSEGQSPIKD